MKFNSFFLYGALSAVAVAAIGWSVWSTNAVAQDVESPVVPADAVEPDDASATEVHPDVYSAGPEFKPAPSNRASQLEPAAPVQSAQSRTNPYSQQPSLDPYSASTQPPTQVVSGTRIGLPGPPVYHDPNRSGVLLPLQSGTYSVQVRETDVEAVKRFEAYQQLQNDINELLQRRHEPKSDLQWSELRQQIAEATAKQFDLRQQLREREIEQLKKRLAEVESTVASRNKLKNEIVEKRVADILREPDQLQWEPLSIGNTPNSVPIPPGTTGFVPARGVQNQSAIPAPPAKTYVPRTITRIERETIVDEDGNKKIVDKPVAVTEYVDVEPARIVPIPDASSPSALSPSPLDATTAFGDQRQLAPASLSVAEAAARVRFFEAKRDQLRVKSGENIDRSELKSLDAEVELAKLIHARAQVEYEGRTKLMELDVRLAESVYEQATAALNESQRINKSSPDAIPSIQVARQEASLEQARIELERAKTLLDIHQKSNAPHAVQPQVTY